MGVIFWMGVFLGIALGALLIAGVSLIFEIRETWSDIDLIRRHMEKRHQIQELEAKL